MRVFIVLMFFVFLSVSSAWAVSCGTNMEDNGNGTVTDSNTGLTWKQCLQGYSGSSCGTAGTTTTFTWSDALALDDGTWRVPNIKELYSIVDEGQNAPAINSICFPGTPASSVAWSSSPYSADSTKSWLIQFATGISGFILQSNTYTVRLVKGP
ncbi:MAG: DUF1566 domain-containing protein [Candidatus Electrothrix sp. AR3]|nr:DUF1566 domain-containing protein [Candidatus Electrothrix sp. AR3]